ncbi:hypothetical protein [Gluconobacter japonicus]|uniref:Uncharacterized protein n=1 Tax=Gluconobacter japonicus TaxID=376620 RepID=A0A9Q2ITZ0_GLUJA|nr:hypothetical protein [Gluconobacter japonicus]MBF0869747.1 hypothetical protein [Gluconobacter japonicus]
MNGFMPEARLEALEEQVKLLVSGLNAISNDKIPRITVSEIEGATVIDTIIDDDTISDVEAAISDAKRLSEKAQQDTRRLESSVRILRYISARLLEAAITLDPEDVLQEAESWINDAGAGKIRIAAGLEERAALKEIEELRKIVSSIE